MGNGRVEGQRGGKKWEGREEEGTPLVHTSCPKSWKIPIAELIWLVGAATPIFAPGGKHPRAATDWGTVNLSFSCSVFFVHNVIYRVIMLAVRACYSRDSLHQWWRHNDIACYTLISTMFCLAFSHPQCVRTAWRLAIYLSAFTRMRCSWSSLGRLT